MASTSHRVASPIGNVWAPATRTYPNQSLRALLLPQSLHLNALFALGRTAASSARCRPATGIASFGGDRSGNDSRAMPRRDST
ncbi:hypothetical protein GW17_00053045, partial [Ensete ventricosum]